MTTHWYDRQNFVLICFGYFTDFANNLYISRTSDRMNMLTKREKWRGEGKISQRDVIRKTREIQKSKRRAVQLLRVAGPIFATKKNKKQVQISFCVLSTAQFCDFTNARTVSISSGSPLRPPTDWQWKADKNYPPGSRYRNHFPFLFSLFKLILVHRHNFKQKTEIPWKEIQEPDSLLQLELERNNLSSIEALACWWNYRPLIKIKIAKLGIKIYQIEK